MSPYHHEYTLFRFVDGETERRAVEIPQENVFQTENITQMRENAFVVHLVRNLTKLWQRVNRVGKKKM
jgi:hypothetical protein